jgi:four helix bundle protein
MPAATKFEELLVWQLMHELHIEVWKATETPPAARDFRFRDQIRDASESTVRNVAEGFGRFNPGQFAAFLDISRASALETKALLKKGLDVGYWSENEFKRLDTLADRGLQALAKFQRYLRSPRAKRNAEGRYGRDDTGGTKNVNANGTRTRTRTARTNRTTRTFRTCRTTRISLWVGPVASSAVCRAP